MKQTPMKRNKPMQRTPFARVGVLAQSSFQRKAKTPDRTDKIARVNHKRKESSIFRSNAYLALVRTVPCVACGIPHLTQAAHSNQLIYGKGRSLKASDASAMALCATTQERSGCHADHDQGGSLSKAEWKAFENQNIVATIMALVKAGRLVGDLSAVTTKAPPAGSKDFELKALFLVGLVERGELAVVA